MLNRVFLLLLPSVLCLLPLTVHAAPPATPPPVLRWLPVTQVKASGANVKLETPIDLSLTRDLLRDRDYDGEGNSAPMNAGDKLPVIVLWVAAQEAASQARATACGGAVPIVDAAYVTVEAKNDDEDDKEFARLTVTPPKGCVLRAGDLIGLPLRHPPNPRLLFGHLDRHAIAVSNHKGEPMFPGDAYWVSQENGLKEMARVKSLLAELKAAIPVARKSMPTPFLTTGADAGKTLAELLEAATEHDVVDALAYLVRNTQQTAGNTYNIVNAFAIWVRNGRAHENPGELELLSEYDRLVKLAPIWVDIDAGTVDGKPLVIAAAQWKTLWPTPDVPDPKRKVQPGQHDSLEYSLMGNQLRFDPAVQEVTLLMSHRWIRGTSLEPAKPYHGLQMAEVIQRFGKPTRILGTEAKPTAFLYAKPWGTLAFHLNAVFSGQSPTVNFVHLYPVQPDAIHGSVYLH